jgi:hypothetical protein
VGVRCTTFVSVGKGGPQCKPGRYHCVLNLSLPSFDDPRRTRGGGGGESSPPDKQNDRELAAGWAAHGGACGCASCVRPVALRHLQPPVVPKVAAADFRETPVAAEVVADGARHFGV